MDEDSTEHVVLPAGTTITPAGSFSWTPATLTVTLGSGRTMTITRGVEPVEGRGRSPAGSGTFSHPGVHTQTHYDLVDRRWLFTCAECGSTFTYDGSYGACESVALNHDWQQYLVAGTEYDVSGPHTIWRCRNCARRLGARPLDWV